MNPFDFLKSLYNKTKLEYPNPDDGFCIFMNKWLSYDMKTVKYVKAALPYLFFISSDSYLKLLYFLIPYSQPPYIKKPAEIVPEEDNPLINKVQYVLGWTNKEMQKSKIIFKQILKNEKYWKTELGVS